MNSIRICLPFAALAWLSACTAHAPQAARSVQPPSPVAEAPSPSPVAPPEAAPPAQAAADANAGVPEPYTCPLPKCIIVSGFGPRVIPGKTESETNTSVNLRVTPGQAVKAARSGKVIFAGFSKEYVSRANKNEQHRLVIVLSQDGESTRYVHLNSFAVKPMQQVQAGDVLGTAADSDEWTVPVLRFEIRSANGQPVDPASRLAVTRP